MSEVEDEARTRFEFMPDPQFNHDCPTCGASNDPVSEHNTGHWFWRTCCVCGECEGVRLLEAV